MIEVLRVERKSLYLHLHVHINRGPIVVELTIRSLIFHLFALPLNAHWKNAHPLLSTKKLLRSPLKISLNKFFFFF